MKCRYGQRPAIVVVASLEALPRGPGFDPPRGRISALGLKKLPRLSHVQSTVEPGLTHKATAPVYGWGRSSGVLLACCENVILPLKQCRGPAGKVFFLSSLSPTHFLPAANKVEPRVRRPAGSGLRRLASGSRRGGRQASRSAAAASRVRPPAAGEARHGGVLPGPAPRGRRASLGAAAACRVRPPAAGGRVAARRRPAGSAKTLKNAATEDQQDRSQGPCLPLLVT